MQKLFSFLYFSGRFVGSRIIRILRSVLSKGLLKPDIMVRKAAMVTYILSSSKNLENYRKLIYDEKIALW